MSTDGTSVVFSQGQDFYSPRDIWVMGADGEGARKIVEAGETEWFDMSIQWVVDSVLFWACEFILILATCPLDGEVEQIRSSAQLHGRILGAPAEEIEAAATSVAAALRHPLMERARKAAASAACYREIPVTLREDQMERIKACLDAGVKVISLFWGDPKDYLPEIRSARAVAIVHVGSVNEAKRAADLGADAVLCQGFEAGGHVRGTIGSIALVPAVVDAVAPLPVVAAGGFADGRGLAAALVLGASGVCMGTRFVASEESRAHPGYKQRVLEAQPEDTIYTQLFDGGWKNAYHRVIRNSTVKEWELAGGPSHGLRPGEAESIGQLHGKKILRYDDFAPVLGMEGDWERCALYAGQSVGVVQSIGTAADIVREVAVQAANVIKHLNQPYPELHRNNRTSTCFPR